MQKKRSEACFTHSISFATYSEALIQLRAGNAFLEPTEGKLRF